MQLYCLKVLATVERIRINIFHAFGNYYAFERLHICECKALNFLARCRNFEFGYVCIILEAVFVDVVNVKILGYCYLAAGTVILTKVTVENNEFRAY